MRIETRTADASDVDALVKLNSQVQRLHATLHPEDFKAEMVEADLRAFIPAAMSRDGAKWVIAEADGGAVGYAWLELQIWPETPFRFARRRVLLHHLCVDADHRRRGVASALMDHAEGFAQEHDAEEIALDAWSSNAGAQSFFRFRGYEPFTLFMRKRSAQAPRRP